jgi:tRNA(Ile)-lysidine synthetase-like protein
LIFSSGENFGGVLIIDDFLEGPISLPDGRHLELNHWNGTVEVLSQHPNIAFLDESCLHFPLTIRRWQPGDWFCPLGMGGKRQKLQDFFSNNKLSRIEKKKVWLLESNGKIAWVVGWRLDERFKVTSTTNQIIQAVFL